MKVCIKCNIPKELNKFHTDNRLKFGVKGKCKECYKKYYLSEDYKKRRNRQSGESIRRSKDNLTDNYIIRQLCHHNNLTPNDIRKFPELIETKRQVILTNKIIKDERRNIKCKGA